MTPNGRKQIGFRRFGAFAALAIMLAGCNAEPFEYTETHDLPAGPGLFTGKSGEYELSRNLPAGQSEEEKQAGETAAQ